MSGDSLTAADTDRDMITGMWTVAAGGRLTSVLVCDDRPPIRQAMTDLLRPLPGLDQIRCVTDGFELTRTFTDHPVDLVLIGIRGDSTVGTEAMGMLIAMHPTAVVIVFGAVTETDTLAAAYIRGARGLLFWDPDEPPAGGLIF